MCSDYKDIGRKEYEIREEGNGKMIPIRKWPQIIRDEVVSLPAAVRSLDLRFTALIIIASLAMVLAAMVGKLSRTTDFVLFVWGPEAAERAAFYLKINWALFYIIGFFIIPIIAVLVVFRESPKHFGLGLGKLPRHLPIYCALALLAAPMVVIASQTDVFLSKYPKMPANSLGEYLALETLYVAQFVGVEFFFRGFLLFPSVRKFGVSGILLPIVPYCMLHFAKPIPEAIGAIFAGILLGYYAWKSRSIWGGVALHSLVAVTMDTLAIIQKRGSFF